MTIDGVLNIILICLIVITVVQMEVNSCRTNKIFLFLHNKKNDKFINFDYGVVVNLFYPN